MKSCWNSRRAARPRGGASLTLWAAAALGMLAVGCGESGPSAGSLVVEWNIPIGCSATQVVAVEARAIPLEAVGADAEPIPVGRIACANRNPFQFSTLPAGRYRIEVEGFNANDVGTHLGVAPDVRVRAGQQAVTDSITLTQKPSAIDVIWVFQNGMLCTHNGIDHVTVGLFDDASVQHLTAELAAPFPCDPGAEMPLSSRVFGASPEPIAKVKGLLLGSLPPHRTFHIHVIAFDAQGQPQMKAEAVAKTELGRVSLSTLVLVSCWDDERAPNVSCL